MKKTVEQVGNTLYKRVVLWTVCWIAAVFGLAYLAETLFIFVPTYPYYSELLVPLAPEWLARWGGFDGVHYLTIIKQGYLGTGLIQAFFPVYPYLVRALNFVHNPLITGLAVSAVCTVASVVMLVKLALLHKETKTSSRLYVVGLVAALLSFPTAFFFLGLYTESLFLLLVLGAWYSAYKKNWLLAAVLAGFASGTKVVGIALFPALLTQAYVDHRSAGKKGLPRKEWLILCLSAAGLIAYMVFLYVHFHDPLYFFHVQHAFNTGRQENLVLFPQVVYRYIKILLTYRPINWLYYAYAQELVLTLEVGIVLAIMTRQKELRNLPFLVFSWLTYLLPTFTGTFGSMPRYVLVIFPLYLFYAKLFVRRPRLAAAVFCLHGILLVINIALFVQGKWVA